MMHFSKGFVRRITLAAALVSSTISLQPAAASSPDAWEEFRLEVQTACLRAATGMFGVTSIQVDPFGSESYGFAVIFGVAKETSKSSMIACAFDKQKQVAEISTIFDR